MGHTLRMGCVVSSARRQKVACDAVHRKLLWVRREAVLESVLPLELLIRHLLMQEVLH